MKTKPVLNGAPGLSMPTPTSVALAASLTKIYFFIIIGNNIIFFIRFITFIWLIFHHI